MFEILRLDCGGFLFLLHIVDCDLKMIVHTPRFATFCLFQGTTEYVLNRGLSTKDWWFVFDVRCWRLERRLLQLPHHRRHRCLQTSAHRQHQQPVSRLPHSRLCLDHQATMLRMESRLRHQAVQGMQHLRTVRSAKRRVIKSAQVCKPVNTF